MGGTQVNGFSRVWRERDHEVSILIAVAAGHGAGCMPEGLENDHAATAAWA